MTATPGAPKPELSINKDPGRRRTALLLFLGITAAGLIALGFVKRIPQDLAYHNFADHRELLGIPNALNVLSNLPFLFVGIWGAAVVLRSKHGPDSVFLQKREKYPYLALFAAVTLVTFGSGYYHWHPDNATLLWDRIPMAIGFMALFAAMIGERIGVRWGMRLLPVLVLAGPASVLYWYRTESEGRGDLRPYLAVQFLPLILIPLLMLLFPARYSGGGKLLAVFGLYGIAKALEVLDAPIYRLARIVSGHTLKHGVAALAVSLVVVVLRSRHPGEEPTTHIVAGT